MSGSASQKCAIAANGFAGTVRYMTTHESTSTTSDISLALLRHSLLSEFSRRYWRTLRAWTGGASTRSATIASLRRKLLQLADRSPELSAIELVTRLTAAHAVASAISCRVDDHDSDSSNDLAILRESTVGLKLLFGEGSYRHFESASNEYRAALRDGLPARIREAAAQLDDELGEATSELAACIGLLVELASY